MVTRVQAADWTVWGEQAPRRIQGAVTALCFTSDIA